MDILEFFEFIEYFPFLSSQADNYFLLHLSLRHIMKTFLDMVVIISVSLISILYGYVIMFSNMASLIFLHLKIVVFT